MAVMGVCCCCCNVKTGATVIGIFSLLGAISLLAGVGTVFNQPMAFEGSLGNGTYVNVTGNSPDVQAIVNKNIKMVKDFKIALLVIASIYLVSCLAMIIGVCQDNGCIMLPFIVMDFIRLIVYFVVFVCIAIFLSTLVPLIGNSYLIAFCVMMIIAFILWFYWWLCVVAAYQQTKEKERISPVHAVDGYPMSYDHMAYPN